MEVAVLAGGRGSRLAEETVIKPKPVVNRLVKGGLKCCFTAHIVNL